MNLWDLSGVDLDPIYEMYRDSDHPQASACRAKLQEMWINFEPYADTNFLDEFSRNVIQRYWEMHVGCFLLSQGFSLSENYKPSSGAGPDFRAELENGEVVWVECIAPTPGAAGPNYANTIDHLNPEPFEPPKRQVELRITSAVAEKNQKATKYREEGIIGNEPYIIALSYGFFSTEAILSEIDYPIAVTALFPIGPYIGIFSSQTGELLEANNEVSNVIKKHSVENSVTVDIDRTGFLTDKYSDTAAVLTHPGTPTSDDKAIVIHNPKGRPSLPLAVFHGVDEYSFEILETTYKMRRHER